MQVNRELFDQVMVPNYAPGSVIPVRGQGARIWDQNDKEYIDLACGIAVTALGHCHPKLVAALETQGRKLWHLSNVMTNEPALRLAKKLTDATFADRVYFCNSGAEANEAALKLARRYASIRHGEGKHEIVSFSNSFHGRTLFTVSVGGQPKYSEHFGPLPGGIRHLPFNDLAAAEAAIGPQTCAVIVEPVQGEGGVMPAAPGFLEGLRAACDRHDALLVFDEVQSGVGRSGSLYAYMQTAVAPDVLSTAKGLGGGFPIGGMLTTAEIAAYLPVGTHGTTFGGNPLGCAVARRVLDIVAAPAFLEGVQQRSQAMRGALQKMAARHGVFEGVRGIGLPLGAVTAEAWRGRAGEIVKAGQAAGVWCLVAGPDVVRFAPPLNLDEAEMREGLARLDSALATLRSAA